MRNRPFIPKPTHHQKKSINDDFYNSGAWRSTSRNHKANNPFCVWCLFQGIRNASNTITDHIISLEYGGSPYSKKNHWTLCRSDHNRKTAQEKDNGCPIYRFYYNEKGDKLPVLDAVTSRPMRVGSKRLINLCGNIGTGKSTLMTHLGSKYECVSIDELRGIYKDEVEAWKKATHLINHSDRDIVVFESSGVNPKLNRIYMTFTGSIVNVMLYAPDEVCYERVKDRAAKEWLNNSMEFSMMFNLIKTKLSMRKMDVSINTHELDLSEQLELINNI